MIAGILRQLISLVELSNLQKDILALASQVQLNASRFISKLNVPRSTAWHNLRSLRSKGLIDWVEGKPVFLTELGKLFSRDSSIAERSAVDREGAGASLAREICRKAEV